MASGCSHPAGPAPTLILLAEKRAAQNRLFFVQYSRFLMRIGAVYARLLDTEERAADEDYKTGKALE